MDRYVEVTIISGVEREPYFDSPGDHVRDIKDRVNKLLADDWELIDSHISPSGDDVRPDPFFSFLLGRTGT
jgi:hypothetical protein